MDRLVELDKPGDFVGKKALETIKERGAKRRLVGLEIHGAPLADANQEFWPVLHGGQAIGHITRCVHSPRLERNIGIANVPTELAAVDTDLAAVAPFGKLQATVCETPWFPSQTTIPKVA